MREKNTYLLEEHNSELDFYDEDYSWSPLHSQQRIFQKNRCAFCDKNNQFSDKCLKVTDPKLEKISQIKHDYVLSVLRELIQWYAFKKQYTCKKCEGKHDIDFHVC